MSNLQELREHLKELENSFEALLLKKILKNTLNAFL